MHTTDLVEKCRRATLREHYEYFAENGQEYDLYNPCSEAPRKKKVSGEGGGQIE